MLPVLACSLGAVLIVGGLCTIYPPAAAIVLGVSLVSWALLRESK